MSTGDVMTKHTVDSTLLRVVEVKVPVLSENGTNDTYIKKQCLQGLLTLEADKMDVDDLDFLIQVPVMLVLILGGVFGNSLITWVLWRQQRRTLTGMLLSMMALTDNFVLVFYFMHFSLPTMYEYGRGFEDYYIFYARTKIYIWFGYVASRTMSIYAVVLVVANRYLSVACTKAIAYLRKINYAKLGMALVIALSILVNFPQILLFESVPYYDPCGESWIPKIEKSSLLHRKDFIVAYQLIFHLIMLYAFPACILVFCLLKLLPYTKRKKSLPPTNVEETIDGLADGDPEVGACDTPSVEAPKVVLTAGCENRTGKFAGSANRNPGKVDFELKDLGQNHATSLQGAEIPLVSRPGHKIGVGEASGKNSRKRPAKNDFCDGDVESPAIVNERIVAVVYAFIFLHTIAIVLHIIITATRLNGPRMGTGNKTSMVLSEFHELLLGSFSAIKFYLFIFIGRRYWHALEKTFKLCTDSRCKWCTGSSREDNTS
ncbi:uncharacterized protein LOC135502756 [Lineus longissimus]|uniref:uncharacterized protein LOC135502756 n=1 Tax=Lineus longissimus TaxID=88925 RepID=UPI002B4DEBEE